MAYASHFASNIVKWHRWRSDFSCFFFF